MLLALTSAGRSSEICNLSVSFMAKTHNSYIFTLDKLTKSRKQGSKPLTIEFVRFSDNDKLCVFQAIECYLKRTQGWRTENSQTQLLLSTLQPHKAVVKSTVAGWIKTVLGKVS